MRISDRSSNVCSSDLHARGERRGRMPVFDVPNACISARFRAKAAARQNKTDAEWRRKNFWKCGGRWLSCCPTPCYGCGWKTTMNSWVTPPVRCERTAFACWWVTRRSEEHTYELQSLKRRSYAVFCLKKKRQQC